MDIKFKQVLGTCIFLFICLTLLILQLFEHFVVSQNISKNMISREKIALLKKRSADNNNTLKVVVDRNVSKQCFRLSFKNQSLEELRHMTAALDIGNTENKNVVKCVELWKRTTTVSRACTRFVTLAHSMGRIGNQLFETASVIGLAYKYDAIPIIPSWLKLRQYFDLPNVVDTKQNQLVNIVSCREKRFAMFYNCSKEFSSQANISVYGFRQSWKYFSDIGEIIRTVFKFKSRHTLNASRFLSNVSIPGYQRVCIHVRRGDLTFNGIKKLGYLMADKGYIERAQTIFIKKYKKVQFLVISDDKEWCRKNLKDVIISTLTDPGDEMALMKLSDHVIVTVGTFGWWGAWLSGGTTVYLRTFAKPGSGIASGINKDDVFPSSWIGLT